MLTRRHLRIKALQALYAYFQSESERMDTSAKNLITSLDRIYDLAIYQFSFLLEMARFAKNRMEDARLKFLPTQEDLNPNTRFVENSFLRQLSQNRSLIKHIDSLRVSWTEHEDLLRRIYNLVKDSEEYKQYMALPESNYKEDKEFISLVFNHFMLPDGGLQSVYEEKNIFWTNDATCERLMLTQDYFISEGQGEQPDREILRKIYRLSGTEGVGLEVLCEEDSIYHENDYYIASWIINRIIRDFRSSWDEFTPLPALLKTHPGDDNDEDYILKLFRKVILRTEELNTIINAKAHNWELDRIAVMDVLIMKMAIIELMEFPSIPVKVTMNEYIELAKIYSTPKSSQFINGLLDKILSGLKEENLVKKSGRGLLES